MSQTPPLPNSLESSTKKLRSLWRLGWKVRGSQSDQPEESYLCATCERLAIEVSHFVVKEGEGANAVDRRVQRYLGRLTDIRARRYCPFCRLVLEITDRPPDQRTPSSFSEADTTVFARWVVDGQIDLGEKDPATGRNKYKPRTRRALIYGEPQTFKDGYIALLSESAPFNEFFGRRLKSHNSIDREVIRSWLTTCEKEHGPECEDSLVHTDLLRQPKNILRMIDVEQMCVVEVPQDCRFVALSYLWGKNFHQIFTTSENLPKLSQPGALMREALPNTIRDSILLTKMLGEKYLWTDSLALIHDVGFQYHDDWVYARACLTVVAGSGKDANAGLPGVREKSRQWHQTIEEVTPGTNLMVSHLAEDYISTSQWDSRAWTFQERMLSRRCLLFVNGRVYFQCRRSTFCEDMEMPELNGWSLDSIDMPTRIFKEHPFLQFTSAVELYTRRDLTNPLDILDAFGGVQKVLEKRLACTIYNGMMESRMNSSLIWESSKKLFARKHGFPSWSWAGWYGEIQWKFAVAARSWIIWHAVLTAEGEHVLQPQEMAPIEPPIPYQKPQRKAVKNITAKMPPFLHFDTIEAMFMLEDSLEIHKTDISPLRKRLTGPSPLSTVRPAPTDPGLVRVSIKDRYGHWCGTIDLDLTYAARCHQAHKFIVMSRLPMFAEEEKLYWEDHIPDQVHDIMGGFEYGVYNVILVREVKGVYYREGLGRILASSLDKALEPGPCWTNVLLG